MLNKDKTEVIVFGPHGEMQEIMAHFDNLENLCVRPEECGCQSKTKKYEPMLHLFPNLSVGYKLRPLYIGCKPMNIHSDIVC